MITPQRHTVHTNPFVFENAQDCVFPNISAHFCVRWNTYDLLCAKDLDSTLNPLRTLRLNVPDPLSSML